MLKCMLVEKAQLAFSALSEDESKNYRIVKATILKAYKCVFKRYLSIYSPFIKGQVSLEDKEVQEKILHDTGAMDNFILEAFCHFL